MITVFYEIPRDTLLLLFLGAALAAMLFGMLVFKPVMRLLLGSGPDLNESISYSTAGFSLFYGLLLGLLTVAAYQNNDRVRQAMLTEATGLGSLYAAMSTYPEPLRGDLRAMMRDYARFTIDEDWQAHRKGTFLDAGQRRIDAMRQRLAGFEPQTRGQEIVHAEMLASFSRFLEARQMRLASVFVQLPAVLWYTVFFGALMSILLICLMRMRPVRQFFLGAVSAVFMATILYVIVTLDAPLRGADGLPPLPMQLVLGRVMTPDAGAN